MVDVAVAALHPAIAMMRGVAEKDAADRKYNTLILHMV
jgi:hypothetical protein